MPETGQKTAVVSILVLSDGKAGHVSSSKGMAQLIAQATQSVTHILEIRLRAKFLRPLLRLLINSHWGCRLSRLFNDNWIRFFYQGYRPLRGDVVISTGGDTIYLNAYAGRCLSIPNFFCGSMRGINPDLFRLIVHTRQVALPNWKAMSVLPISLDLGKADLAAETFSSQCLEGRRENLWALLIGGKGNGYEFNEGNMVEMLEQCASLAKHHGKSLLVTTSRRTGPSAETAIASWLDMHLEAPLAYSVLYGKRPERIAGAFMRLAELVFCSEESTSMVSESVYCRRPVVTLAPLDAHPTPDQQDFLSKLEEQRHIRRMQIGAIEEGWLEEFLAIWKAYDGEEHRELQTLMLAELPEQGGSAPISHSGH